jgi:integrase
MPFEALFSCGTYWIRTNDPLLNRLYNQLAKPVRDTTISNYMRALSSIFGKAIEEGEISKRDFPFDLSRLNTKTQKRAISKVSIADIVSLEIPTGSALEFARDIFLFSYYCRGLNFVDLAQIKWSDIHDGRLIYRRSKTSSQFNIKLLPPALEILSRYENIRDDSGYVFPVYNTYHDTPQKQFDRRKKILKTVNASLRTIGEKIGVHLNLTSYVARHTYASVMMRSGAKTSVIKDSLGHSRIQTTEIYLDSFGSEELDEANEGIL